MSVDADDQKAKNKALKKLERKLQRAEERLVSYERLVDRTQHLLNTRIHEVEEARAELEESETRFRNLADAAFETILIHADGIILDCNDAAENLYKIPKADLIGSPILERVHPTFHEQVSEWLHGATQKAVEVTQVRGDGCTFPVEVRSRTLVQHHGEALVTAVRDITAHKELQEKLRNIANSDPLTGVGNRRFFMESGNKEFFRAKRYDNALSLFMLDVDHFKKINDTYGHDVGDIALKALSNICTETVRGSDVFARIGGEEFAAVLPSTDLSNAMALGERLRKNVEANAINGEFGELKFTVSMGVTAMTAEDNDIETLLGRADKGLYEAKEGGRNCVIAFKAE